jgi:hypothetical protein
MANNSSCLLPEVRGFVEDRLTELDGIPVERQTVLSTLTDFIAGKMASGQPSRLVFICTHNSRRSHMAQLWAQVAAEVFSVPDVETFSGGTEATAFNPRAVSALRRAGFVIDPFTDGKNPIYEVSFEEGMEPMQAFSKVFDHAPNPADGFAAVMTCTSADAACPVVEGADKRITIPYDDPKAHDCTEQEAAKYDERCAHIAREMLWVFSEVTRKA